MVLGISEDLTSNVTLDSELTSIPSSGIYLNSGVHPSITVENLLEFLPKTVFNFTAYDNATSYGVFSITRNKKDIVSHDGKIYQSIKSGSGNAVTDTDFWLETNIESLRIKTFLQKVQDRVYSDLNLNKRLVNSQYLYENGEHLSTLPNDYAGWMIEPKGSDYVSFRVNEISLQKDGTTPVNLYILNQKTLLDTITVTPNNGQLNFKPVDLVLQGKGEFKLVIDSTDIYRGNGSIDPLKFNGFVATTVNGTGDAPENAKYTYNTTGNGIGLNLSAFLDATSYIEDNLEQIAGYIRVTFELMCFEMFLHNSNNRSNRSQRIQMRDEFLIAELKDMQNETVIRRYHREKKRAIESIERTFDTQLNNRDKLTVKISSY
jgi:hypothetical protein